MTSTNYATIARLTLAERIADKRFLLKTVSDMPWNKHKAAIISRVSNELYELVTQMSAAR